MKDVVIPFILQAMVTAAGRFPMNWRLYVHKRGYIGVMKTQEMNIILSIDPWTLIQPFKGKITRVLVLYRLKDKFIDLRCNERGQGFLLCITNTSQIKPKPLTKPLQPVRPLGNLHTTAYLSFNLQTQKSLYNLDYDDDNDKETFQGGRGLQNLLNICSM